MFCIFWTHKDYQKKMFLFSDKYCGNKIFAFPLCIIIYINFVCYGVEVDKIKENKDILKMYISLSALPTRKQLAEK